MDMFRETSFTRVEKGLILEKDELIVVEAKLELWVEEMQVSSFSYSPGLEREMVLGHMISSGLISSIDALGSIDIEKNRCVVTTENKNQFVRNLLQSMSDSTSDLSFSFTNSGIVPIQVLHDAEQKMRKLQEVHKITGGTHAALITNMISGESVFAEDIGRHNAIDKTIGLALGKEFDMGSSFLFITGRLTSEIVNKGVNARIPLMCSLAVASDLGIQIALNSNMTLLGRMSADAFWIYCKGALSIE